MSFFGIYCGFMYNDFLSIPINFPTCYIHKVNEQYLNNTNGTNVTFYELNKEPNCNYKFGIDPIWIGASNELTVINSLKMKLSVIFGFLQMILGIFLKGLNSILEGDLIEFLFVFLPQLLLMGILFGYMNILIIIKWNQKYLGEDSKKAPDIKSIMMDIFLKPNGEYNKNFAPIWGNEKTIQQFHFFILIISAISILIMIIPTVIGKNYQEKSKYENYENQKKNVINNQNDYSEELIDNNKNEIIKKSFSDILINVLIESIEFVLGTVSNTASYLRLWALSLAHSQLSKVFFNGTIGIFSNTNSIILNSILLSTFGIISFFIVTSIVLLFMDMMECFLHTLRLHWVEFQNKFFYADGYLFHTFSFNELIDNEIPNINE
jgi:V-type H+-transporting ATPase subunit a